MNSATATPVNRLVLLPGMDGTGSLFSEFLKSLPRELFPVVVEYPRHIPLDYDHLVALVEEELPAAARYILLAESFSGPIALRIATQKPTHLAGVILVSSFSIPPWGRCGRWLRYFCSLFSVLAPIPTWGIRRFMMEQSASAEQVAAVKSAIGSVLPRVMSLRMREALTCHVAEDLGTIRVPVLSIVGRQDRLISPGRVQGFVAGEQSFEEQSIDGPHLLLQSRPAECVQVIEAFLARHGLSGQSAAT